MIFRMNELNIKHHQLAVLTFFANIGIARWRYWLIEAYAFHRKGQIRSRFTIPRAGSR
ncbi:hypothetical protein D3C77_278810 [compost metagenome]